MAIGIPRLAEPFPADVADGTRQHIGLRLLPFLFVLYVANYIDRTNVAYATIGMSRDLKFNDAVFGLGSGIFFISYLALQIPGALLAERWMARGVISATMVAWGAVTALTALIHTPAQLYLARFALGAAESAFFPSVLVYLSRWFSRADRGKATNSFMAAIPVSSVIGSPIAGWILGYKWLGAEGWRWLFIVEGLPAMVLGVIAFFYLTDAPGEAKWLTAERREWIQDKLREDAPVGVQGMSIRQALRSRAVMSLAAVCFLNYFAFYSMLFWMPTMLKRLSGLSDANVGLLGALPYLALFVAMSVNAWHSDKRLERHWHCAVPILIATAGFAGLLMQPRSVPWLLLFFTIATLGNAYLPAFFSIPTEMLSQSAAAASLGTINAVGSLAGFAGPYLVGYLNTKSGSFSYGLMAMMIAALAGGLVVIWTPRMVAARTD